MACPVPVFPEKEGRSVPQLVLQGQPRPSRVCWSGLCTHLAVRDVCLPALLPALSSLPCQPHLLDVQKALPLGSDWRVKPAGSPAILILDAMHCVNTSTLLPSQEGDTIKLSCTHESTESLTLQCSLDYETAWQCWILHSPIKHFTSPTNWFHLTFQ